MSSVNHPDKVTLDAFSDPQLQTANGNGYYNRFTNILKTPILNAKAIQLLNANFINSALQLNDSGQLVFWFYASSTQANIRSAGLYNIRLHPSTFVPYPGYTTFVKNKYFNSVSELVSALNSAASTGGDSFTYNPRWIQNQVSFTYDTASRKISVVPLGALFIAPASADDPNVVFQSRSATNQPKMNGYNSSNTYATATVQPFVLNVSMNARLGFAMNFNARGLWWDATSQQGCATSTGVPQNTPTTIEADAFPILLGSQNVSLYLSIITGSGIDATGRKNLLCSIPIEVAPLTINSYTASSVEIPAKSIPNEIYEIGVEMLDDIGTPFLQPPNFNTELSLVVYY